jgi:hypothetical protein
MFLKVIMTAAEFVIVSKLVTPGGLGGMKHHLGEMSQIGGFQGSSAKQFSKEICL